LIFGQLVLSSIFLELDVQMISRQQSLATVTDTTANLNTQFRELMRLRAQVRRAQLAACLPKTAIAKQSTPSRSRPRGRSRALNIAE
jgi:hypothetical protein